METKILGKIFLKPLTPADIELIKSFSSYKRLEYSIEWKVKKSELKNLELTDVMECHGYSPLGYGRPMRISEIDGMMVFYTSNSCD